MKFNKLSESQKQTEIMYMLRGKLSSQYKNEEEARDILDYLVEYVNKAAGTDISYTYQNDRTKSNINSFSKYNNKTEEQIELIKQKIREGLNNSSIHRETGFDRRTIAKIRNEMIYNIKQ